MADETAAAEQAYDPPAVTSLGTIENVTGGDNDAFSTGDTFSDS